jgi:hypothetical protein
MSDGRYPADQSATMRSELDALVNSWIDRGWSLECAAGTLMGYAMHMVKAGKWQTVDQVVASIRAAWPLMKVPRGP